MTNPHFEILNVFPVETHSHTCRELVMAKVSASELRKIERYTNEIDMVKAIIEDEGLGGAKSALEDALQSSSVYKNWQQAMPYLKDVPNIHGFRTKPKHKNNICLVNKEIGKFGGLLPKGQTLYRGGKFVPNDALIVDGPISTTTMPCVARWHAIKVSGSIALLRIAENYEAKAFAFRTKGNQRLAQEFEVLVQNGLKLNHVKSLSHQGMAIHQYDVYVA